MKAAERAANALQTWKEGGQKEPLADVLARTIQDAIEDAAMVAFREADRMHSKGNDEAGWAGERIGGDIRLLK